MSAKTAVLLTNLGTPDRLERASVKRFLKEFLSDPLVVRLPRILWIHCCMALSCRCAVVKHCKPTAGSGAQQAPR